MRAAAALALLLAGCAATPSPDSWKPPVGATGVFDAEPGAAPGHRLMVTDLTLGADAVGAAHSHPWEEYLYILEGSAVLAIENEQPRMLRAGDKVTIPARMVHTPTAGPDGVRAIVTRLHDAGDPVRILAQP